jgi:hypothetical protein
VVEDVDDAVAETVVVCLATATRCCAVVAVSAVDVDSFAAGTFREAVEFRGGGREREAIVYVGTSQADV